MACRMPPGPAGPSRPGPGLRRFRRAADLIQAAQDQGLGVVHAEEYLVEVGGPLPPGAVDAMAAVEAAKNGLEYRPRDGRDGLVAGPQGTAAGPGGVPRGPRPPGFVELAALLNLRPDRPRYEIVVAPGVVPDPIRTPSPPSTDLAVGPPVDGPGLSLPGQRGGGARRAPRGRRREQSDGPRREAVRRAGRDRRSVHRPCLPRERAARGGVRGREVPRLLVLHRRPRRGEQVDIRPDAPAQPARLRPSSRGVPSSPCRSAAGTWVDMGQYYIHHGVDIALDAAGPHRRFAGTPVSSPWYPGGVDLVADPEPPRDRTDPQGPRLRLRRHDDPPRLLPARRRAAPAARHARLLGASTAPGG